MITFASSVQVSGVGCQVSAQPLAKKTASLIEKETLQDEVSYEVQQPNSTRCVGVAHEMDFLSPVLVFSCNQISVQGPVFTDT